MKNQAALLALICLAVSPAWAINKCTIDGKVIFQDAPCASGKAEEIKTHATTATPVSEVRGAAASLCEARLRTVPNWKDPESVRISNVRRGKFTTIKLHDTTIVAVAYIAEVNAKNSYGAYTGSKTAICYLDQTETRVLDILTTH